MWWKKKIAEQEREILSLREENQEVVQLRAQLAAKNQALGAKLGVETQALTLQDVGWALLWAEYWHRTKQFQNIGPDSRRSKVDRYQNKWSIHRVTDLKPFAEIIEGMGYSVEIAMPEEFIILHCFPNEGAYQIACDELERAQARYRQAQNKYAQIKAERDVAIQRGKHEQAERLGRELDVYKIEVADQSAKFAGCKAVIENAVQRFYVIPVEAMERLDSYGIPVQCMTATVTPQKKHLELPACLPPQVEAIIDRDGYAVFPEAALAEDRYSETSDV